MATNVQQTLPFPWQGGRQCRLQLLIQPWICAPDSHLFIYLFLKWRRGVLVSGASLTNGLIQTDHDTKKFGQKRMGKKVCYNFLCIDACMKF